MSSSETTPEQPRKRGRKSIPTDQKKRIYHILCPHCSESFEFYHGMKELKPPPVTSPEMSKLEKNRRYQQRYREKQKKQLESLNEIVIDE